ASGDMSHPVGPLMWLSAATVLVYFCLFPLLAIIALEYRTRGPRPADVSRKAAAAQLLMWPLMAVITFVFASLPALHAQWKLASGKGLVYRVAEKGTKHAPAPMPVPVKAGGE